jgi:hypothetical protein
MLPYPLWPSPPGPTDEALAWDLMLVPHVPYSFLAPSIAFIATIVKARPLFGVGAHVLGTLRNTHFWDPLKFAELWNFDVSVQMGFERVSAWHIFQLPW